MLARPRNGAQVPSRSAFPGKGYREAMQPRDPARQGSLDDVSHAVAFTRSGYDRALTMVDSRESPGS